MTGGGQQRIYAQTQNGAQAQMNTYSSGGVVVTNNLGMPVNSSIASNNDAAEHFKDRSTIDLNNANSAQVKSLMGHIMAQAKQNKQDFIQQGQFTHNNNINNINNMNNINYNNYNYNHNNENQAQTLIGKPINGNSNSNANDPNIDVYDLNSTLNTSNNSSTSTSTSSKDTNGTDGGRFVIVNPKLNQQEISPTMSGSGSVGL